MTTIMYVPGIKLVCINFRNAQVLNKYLLGLTQKVLHACILLHLYIALTSIYKSNCKLFSEE